ncbi:alpha-galactosidase [Kiritimatiellota bacterium B12222]|nr:alpha-galactosidase [Kiritimatiellota bacterium B12222]
MMIYFQTSLLRFVNDHVAIEIDLDQGASVRSLRSPHGDQELVQGEAQGLQVDRSCLRFSTEAGGYYDVSDPEVLCSDNEEVGEQIEVNFHFPLPYGKQLIISRQYMFYREAGALRWVDTWSSDVSVHGLRYSELVSFALQYPGAAKVVDFFTCSDQSNERVSCFDAQAHNVGGLFTHDAEAGIFCYREGPCPDSQPVPTDYDFVYDQDHQHLALVGLGFDRLEKGQSRRANGVVIGLLEDANSLRGLKRYQRIRYRLSRLEPVEYLSNSWPAFFLKINEEKILAELDVAAETGMDTVFIDDGWFDIFMGEVDTERFPQGFTSIKERAETLGLNVGLWMNPLGLDSRHPEAGEWDGAECHDTNIEGNPWNWVARTTNYTPVEKIFSENTRTYMGMDLLNPGYAAHIRKKIIDLNTQFGFKRFKFDLYQLNNYNTLLGDAHEHYEAYRLLLDDLRRAIPDLVISMDVTRTNRPCFDFGMDYGRLFLENRGRRLRDHRYYQPYTSLGNLWRLAQYMPAHRCELEMMPQIDEYPLEYILATTLFAHPLYWGSLSDLSTDKRKRMKAFKEQMAPHKQQIMNQWVIPFGDAPGLDTWSGMMSLDPDTGHGYVVVYRNGGKDESRKFELPGELSAKRLQNVLDDSDHVDLSLGNADFRIPEDFGFRLYSF